MGQYHHRSNKVEVDNLREVIFNADQVIALMVNFADKLM
jgi:hypothetical protein